MTAIKLALSKIWLWLLFGITTTLGTAVLIYRSVANRMREKKEEAEAELEVKRQQAAGFEAVLRQKAHAEELAAAIDRKYAEKSAPDAKAREDFSKPDF